MSYVVVYSDVINLRALKHLVKADLRMIKRAIEEKLTKEPEIFGKPLRQSLRGYRSLRVEDYRVIFRIEKHTVKILLIGHRSAVHPQAAKKLPRL